MTNKNSKKYTKISKVVGVAVGSFQVRENQENKSFKMPKTLDKAAIKDLLAWDF